MRAQPHGLVTALSSPVSKGLHFQRLSFQCMTLEDIFKPYQWSSSEWGTNMVIHEALRSSEEKLIQLLPPNQSGLEPGDPVRQVQGDGLLTARLRKALDADSGTDHLGSP